MIIQRKINDFKLTLLNKNKNINFSIDCNENDKFKEIEDKFMKNFLIFQILIWIFVLMKRGLKDIKV